jgi:hypothetical protein
VLQGHKSTSVRPVGNFIPLNKLIVPTIDPDSASCKESLRRWRTYDSGSVCDVSKAYLRLRLTPEQTWYCCFRHPKSDDMYRMKVVFFGLELGPVVLRVAVARTLRKLIADGKVDPYFDDIFCRDKKSTSEARELLLKHSLPTKEPTEMGESRLLGLDLKRDSKKVLQWSRRLSLIELLDACPDLENCTAKCLASWLGSLVAQVLLISTGINH